MDKEKFYWGYPHYYSRFNLHRFEPWYSINADYNTNAKSYYDYLARIPFMFSTIEEVLNRLLKRDLKVNNTNTITLNKRGGWLTGERCGNYDNDIIITADVNISKLSTQIKLTHQLKNNIYNLKNAIIVNQDGIYSPDLLPIINDIDKELDNIYKEIYTLSNEIKNIKTDLSNINNQITNINNQITNINNQITNLNNKYNDLLNRLQRLENELEDLKKKMPKGLITTVSKVLWQGQANSSDIFTVNEPLTNFDYIKISYHVGGSQFTSEVIPQLLGSHMQHVPTFGGVDVFPNETLSVVGYSGVQCTDQTYTRLKVQPSKNLCYYHEISTNQVTQIFKGDQVRGKDGRCEIVRVEGLKEITY